jgi:hypothetical protein
MTMATFRCVCGTVISTSGGIPNANEWRLLSDTDLDSYQGTVDVEDLYRHMTIAYRCPTSGHLWLFWDGFENDPQVYEPIAPPNRTSTDGV